MNRVRAAVAALVLGAPLAAAAADVTRIASSFEEGDPFGMHLEVGFERVQQRTSLTRERLPRAGEGGERTEAPLLRYLEVDSRLNLGLAVGLWRDLELRFTLPIVFQHNESWDFAASADAESRRTVTDGCLAPNGELTDPACPTTGAGATPLFEMPGRVYRGGLGNLHFGLTYAFFNQAKDVTKPTWLVGLDYEAPTAERLDPTEATTSTSRGNLGTRYHQYTFFTALSRRIGPVEPYVRAFYTLPWRGPGWYSNCDSRDAGNLSAPQNCGTGPWTRSETGIRLPHRTGLTFGSEFNLFEQPAKSQRVALDVRGVANYVSSGRYYNELSGVLGKLLSTEDHGELGGRLGLTASATDVFQVRMGGTLLYHTSHVLTDESPGEDAGDTLPGDVDPGSPELNPNFDFRTDLVSRRFRTAADYVFVFELAATFTF